MTALNFSFRKDVMSDEIMNTISVNIGEVAGRQVYMHVVREAHQKYQGVFLDWQLWQDGTCDSGMHQSYNIHVITMYFHPFFSSWYITFGTWINPASLYDVTSKDQCALLLIQLCLSKYLHLLYWYNVNWKLAIFSNDFWWNFH